MENTSLEQDYINALKTLQKGFKNDLVMLHVRVDDLLVRLLRDLNCLDIARLYEDMSKDFYYNQ